VYERDERSKLGDKKWRDEEDKYDKWALDISERDERTERSSAN
jgi:hypothetical protein